MRPRISSSISRVSAFSSPLLDQVLLDPLRQVGDAAQRRPQVVRGGVGERVELAVAALEGQRQLGELLPRPDRVGDVDGVRHQAVNRSRRVSQRLDDEVEEALS